MPQARAYSGQVEATVRPQFRNTLPLLLGVLGACEPGNGADVKSPGVNVVTDTGEDGLRNRDLPIRITADFPAFYADDGVVTVSGAIEDGTIGDIEALTIDGIDATLDAAKRFHGTVTLADDIPWRVVDLHVRDAHGREGTIQVQVARAATPESARRTDGLAVMAGPGALDELVRHVGTFIRTAELAPPPGAILRRTCEPVNEPDIETGNITEELRLTGAVRVISVAGDVDTDDEALHVSMQGTRIAWGAEVVSVLQDEEFTRDAELVMELGRGDDLPEGPCNGLWAPVSRSPEPATWSAEFAWPPSCFDATDAGAAAAPLYADRVPPELDRASCAWAEWLDTALHTELPGVSTERAVTVDRAGLALDLTTTPDPIPPVQTTDAGVNPESDGLLAAMAPGVVGPVVHAAASLDRADLGTASVGSHAYTWTRVAPVVEVTTLAANDAGAMGVLPSPVGFRVERDGSACVTGHVIPAPAAVTVDDTEAGTRVGLTPRVAGVDEVNLCGLPDADWQAILDAVVQSAFADHAATWRPADGLMLLGADHHSAIDGVSATVDLTVPEP